MAKMKMSTSCGNVFADLDLPNAKDFIKRARLVIALSGVMKQQGLDTATAAARLSLSTGKLEKLLKGRTRYFTTTRISAMINILSQTHH